MLFQHIRMPAGAHKALQQLVTNQWCPTAINALRHRRAGRRIHAAILSACSAQHGPSRRFTLNYGLNLQRACQRAARGARPVIHRLPPRAAHGASPLPGLLAATLVCPTYLSHLLAATFTDKHPTPCRKKYSLKPSAAR